MGSPSTSKAVTCRGRDNSSPPGAKLPHCLPAEHLHRFYLCHETLRNNLHLMDRDLRQGIKWYGLVYLQIAVVWFSIMKPEIPKRDLACKPHWKHLGAVKIIHLQFPWYFASDICMLCKQVSDYYFLICCCCCLVLH